MPNHDDGLAYFYYQKARGVPILRWCNFDTSMDKQSHVQLSRGRHYPFPNFKGVAVEVWEWIRDFISHFIMDVMTYPD